MAAIMSCADALRPLNTIGRHVRLSDMHCYGKDLSNNALNACRLRFSRAHAAELMRRGPGESKVQGFAEGVSQSALQTPQV